MKKEKKPPKQQHTVIEVEIMGNKQTWKKYLSTFF